MSLSLLPWLYGYDCLVLIGLIRTLLIAVASYALGLTLALTFALFRMYAWKWVTRLIGFYSGLMRALPELILIMLLYYVCGDAVTWILSHLGLGQIELNGSVVAIIVLGLVTSAYAVEILIAAINAVPRGAIEASMSLGFGWWGQFRYIILPLMLPLALPGLSNLWLMVLKGTSLVSVLGVMELALATEQGAGATKAYLTFYLTSACIYVLLSVVSKWLFHMFERAIRHDRLTP